MDTQVPKGQVGTAELGFLPDGRIHVVISQSWLNTFAACPEQARATLFDGRRQESENIDALFGKAFHAMVEARISGVPRLAALNQAHAVHAPAGVGSTPEHMANPDQRQALLGKLLDLWEKELSHVNWAIADGVEVSAQRPAYEDDNIVVELHGTADVLLPKDILDWKTTSRKWLGWEVERYNLQSTVYSFIHQRPRTTFCVLDTRKITYQEFPVIRTEGHIASLLDDTIAPVAGLIQATVASKGRTTRWPATGHDWHCSPWRCANWGFCKGSHGITWERKG